MTIRTTTIEARFVSSLQHVGERLTTLETRYIGETEHPSQRLTTMEVRVLARRPASQITRRATTLEARYVATRKILYTWTDEVLNYDLFPTDIGFNSVGADRFATDVVIVDSGSDQRSSRWDQPLIEFDVAYGVRNLDQLQRLRAFFKVMGGRRDSFLFFDWMDHSSLQYCTIDADNADPITATDQLIGTGDYYTYQFQLQKTYTTPSGVSSFKRPITKPQDGTVLVAINNAQVSNFTCDKLTGIVTFTPRWSMTGLNGVILQNANLPNAGWSVDIVLPQALPSQAVVGDRVTLSGFASGLNNFPITNQILVHIISISSDRKTIHLLADNVPASNQVFANETAPNGVSFIHHPAPHTGDTITAGYIFYVPVRFDTDRLPLTISDYGTGSAGGVKLIEVRPYDL